MPEACLDKTQMANETTIAEFVAFSLENRQRNNCNRSNSVHVSYKPLENHNNYAFSTNSENSLHCGRQTQRQICTASNFLSSSALGERKRFCCCSGNNSNSSCWRLKRRQIIWESAQASARNRNEAVEAAAAGTATTNALPPLLPRNSDTLLITHNNEKYCSNITRHSNKISTSLPTTPNLSQLRKPLLFGGVQYRKLEDTIATQCGQQVERTNKSDANEQQAQKLHVTPMSTSKLRVPATTTKTKSVSSQRQTNNQQSQMIIKRSVSSVISDAIDNNNDSKSPSSTLLPHVNAVVQVNPAGVQHAAYSKHHVDHSTKTILVHTQTDLQQKTKSELMKSSHEKSFRKLCERCCKGAGSLSSNDCTNSIHMQQKKEEDAKQNIVGDVDAIADSRHFYRAATESVSDELLSYNFVSDEDEDLTKSRRQFNNNNNCQENTPTAAATTKTTPICRLVSTVETFIDSSSLSSSNSLSLSFSSLSLSHTPPSQQTSRLSKIHSVPFKAKTYEERLVRSTAAPSASTTSTPSKAEALSSSTRISPTICCYTTEKSPKPPKLLPLPQPIPHRNSTLPIDIPRKNKSALKFQPEALYTLKTSNSLPAALSTAGSPFSLPAATPLCSSRDVNNPLKRRLLPHPPPPVPPKPKHKIPKFRSSSFDESLLPSEGLNSCDPTTFRRKVQKLIKEQTLIKPLRTNNLEYETKLPQKFDFNTYRQRQSTLAVSIAKSDNSVSKTKCNGCSNGKENQPNNACNLKNLSSSSEFGDSDLVQTNANFNIQTKKTNVQNVCETYSKKNDQQNLKKLNEHFENACDNYHPKCAKIEIKNVSENYNNNFITNSFEKSCKNSHENVYGNYNKNCLKYETEKVKENYNSNSAKTEAVSANYKHQITNFFGVSEPEHPTQASSSLSSRSGYQRRPRTFRYDSYGRLKGNATTQLPTYWPIGCKNAATCNEIGDKISSPKNTQGNENGCFKISVKREPLPTHVCVASSSAVNKLTPTLSHKLFVTTTTPTIIATILKPVSDTKVKKKSESATKTTEISSKTTTTPTEIINDLQLQKIFKDFKDAHNVLFEENAANISNGVKYKNDNKPSSLTTYLTSPTPSLPNSPQEIPNAELLSTFLTSSSTPSTPLLSLKASLSPKTPESPASPFNFAKKNDSLQLSSPLSPTLTTQQLWLSSETIASRSSEPVGSVQQNICTDDQQSICSDHTTIFHLDNDCCSNSVTSSSTSPSLKSPIHNHQYQLQQQQQQPQLHQHLLLRGPLILKRIPTIQAFGYIPTHSYSLGGGANVRDNGEKEINMEKRRNTLERFQRLGFGRKSSPAAAPTPSSATSVSASTAESVGSSRNRKTSEKSERLRELTELLRGNRSSPTPPPIPPPRKPRNGTQSASNSFEKPDDAATTRAENNVKTSTTITVTAPTALTITQGIDDDDIQLMDQEDLITSDRPDTPSSLTFILDKPPKHTNINANGRRSASPRSSIMSAPLPLKPTASLPISTTANTATMTRFCGTLKPNASLSSFESLILMMGGREKSKSPPPIAENESAEALPAGSLSANVKPVRAESRTFVGSTAAAQKSTPFRSASFSQIDSASGKFKRSALSVLRDRLRRDKAVESTSPTSSLILPTALAAPACNEIAKATKSKTEPGWIYIPLRQRTEMSINLNYGQDQSLEDVLGSPDMIPEEDIFTTDTEQASTSTVELREQATVYTVVASHAKMESLTDTIQSDNDFTIDCDDQLPVSVDFSNISENIPVIKSDVIPSNLATLMEERIPLESPPDNLLQTATTCLIPLPVYECAAQDWQLENPPQEWVEVASEDFGLLPAETPLQPLISLDEAKAKNELPIISVSRSSEEADDRSILRSKIEENTTTTSPPTTVERRQSTMEKNEVKKRYSHDDIEIGVDKQRSVGNCSFDAIAPRYSTDERKRIDKSTRRKGMYIDNADWHDSPVVGGVPHGRGLALDISLVTFNAIKPDDSPDDCNIMYLNSPATENDSRTPGSMYSFDLNTPDSDCNRPPTWSKAPPLTNFSCQSSEEKEETPIGNDAPSTAKVLTSKRPPGLTRHNKSYPILRTESISDNESDRTPPSSARERTIPSPALSDFDFKRYSKRPLRGPYGQMLEAEMKKPNKMRFEEILEDLRGESESATVSRRQRATTTATTSTLVHDDAGNDAGINTNNNRNTPQYSNSMRVRKTNTYLPIPAHTRAASTPSQMENVNSSNNNSSISKSGGGSVDKINPNDKRYQSSFDSNSNGKKRDKDKDSSSVKGTLGVVAFDTGCTSCDAKQTQQQPHHHILTQHTHHNYNNHYQHPQREMKRAASEAPSTKTHHSKRSQSMSGTEKSNLKLQHQQKLSLDVTNASLKSSSPSLSNKNAAKIKPSQELLAELLQGSSEELVSEQRQRMIADTRTHVVQEIFRNEQSYVEALQTIVNKYLKVLKSPEHAGMIDTRTVDEIFFMVPDILEIHETFLADLKSRLDNWDAQQKVGDCFMETFSKLEVLEVYTSFVNNCNRAKNSIRAGKHQRPSFSKFLETTAREHKGKLTLDYLLIKPVQKFPNYELLFQRLIKHTDHDHPDQKHLQDALKLVHDILVHINCKEREILENGQREATLRELEGIIEGITDLLAPDRQFLLFDLVSMPSGQGARKERGFFLFNDLLVLTSIKKRSGTIRKPNPTTCPGTVASTLDTNKYKFLTKISLDCLEIIKTKDENLKRIMNEIDNLAGDCNKLQQITDITTTLRCPHQFLEDVIRELHRDVQRQLSERQTNDAQLNLLELSVNSPNGSQKLSIVFSKTEKRTQWEQAFNEAKQKLAATLERHPIPEFLTSIPIRKTRAGLQFTCASATLSEKRDVWVCNSDGYVGQVCIMSLHPEPNVTSCNGVCNARILCVASVPAYNGGSVGGGEHQHQQMQQRANAQQQQSYTQQLRDFRKSISPNCPNANNTLASGNVSVSGERKPTSGDSNKTSDIQLDLNLSSSDDETDAVAAAAAAAAVAAYLSNQVERVPSPAPVGNANVQAATAASTTSHGHQDSNSEEGEGNQSTMWIGTEDGCIHVYNSTDNIRIKKNRIKIEHHSAVYSILYLDNRVFVALANGDICVYLRDGVGGWNTSSSHCLSIGTVTSPVTKLLNVHGKLWCSIQGIIKVLDIETLLVINQIQISSDSKPITNMTVSNNYVWISIQNSAHIKCFHSNSHQLITEVNLAPAVNKMLSNCDEIIRQHKAACLRVTSLLSCKDLIWIGTSAGVLLTIPAQGYEKLAQQLQQVTGIGTTTSPAVSTIVPTGIPHGHTGHVRFITFVETMSSAASSTSSLTSNSAVVAGFTAESSSTPKDATGVESVSGEPGSQGSSKRSSTKEKSEANNILIISGGDGYEDFRNSGANSLSEIAGREDSTNHLLIWQI